MMTDETSGQLADSVVQSLVNCQTETKSLDFKRQLDTRNEHDLLSLVKDLAAMANSDGGHIIVGVVAKDQTFDVPGIDSHTFFDDPTSLGQRVNAHCSQPLQFSLRPATVTWHGNPVSLYAIHVERAAMPIIFVKPGELSSSPRKRIFMRNDIYIRQDAASTPAAPYQVEALLRARGVQEDRR